MAAVRRPVRSGMLDPRPHLGEPLALDLLNTRWMREEPQDLLTDPTGLTVWLATAGIDAPVAQRTLDALITARSAIHDTVCEADHTALNEVLAHGRVRRALTDAGPVDTPDIPDPAWVPAWLAANDLLGLVARGADRIRQCAHPHCILFFYDTSKNGTRRWHSMATCGNRAKAARHYAKQG